jgi:hypothetical protein
VILAVSTDPALPTPNQERSNWDDPFSRTQLTWPSTASSVIVRRGRDEVYSSTVRHVSSPSETTALRFGSNSLAPSRA